MSTAIVKNLQLGSDPTATNNFTIFQPATPDGTLRIGNGNTGITSSLLTLTSAGNVGIGTSSPKSDVGLSLHLYNSANTGTVGSNTYLLVESSTRNSVIELSGSASATNALVFSDTPGTAVAGIASTVADQNLLFRTGGTTERMRISSTGDLTLRAGSSTTTTHAFIFNESGGEIQLMNASGSTDVLFDSVAGTARYLAFNGAMSIGTTVAQPFIVNTAGVERARIDSSGNLLVGTTSGAARAVVKGNAAGALSLVFNATSAVMVEVNGSNSINGVDGTPNGNGLMRIFRDSGNLRSISAAGSLNAAGADYAEYMTKSGDFSVAKGDIVGIDAQGKLTNIFADAISFCVKSTDPSYVGGDSWGANLKGGDLEAARQKVDRIAFSGQVPVNVLGATPGQYIVPAANNGAIKGVAKSEINITLAEYMRAVGKVIAVQDDGRALIIVKIV